jgi:nucleoside-triphosphatase THEP1
MNNKVIILTGEIQTGKTTLLQQFCIGRNDVAGILTPIVNGKRVFYNIAGNSFFNMEAGANEATVAVGKYLFSASSFINSSSILLKASKSAEYNYLIIDEIGPLEIKQQLGFYPAVKQILSSSYNYTLILVVRQSLAGAVIEKFNLDMPLVLTPDKMKLYFKLSTGGPPVNS